ncbi:MAG: hypothetical protein Q4B85_09725 [Lachnospiraceae bacterium]|nr:hypothetical protein [Lachnospiraceae bacterium]
MNDESMKVLKKQMFWMRITACFTAGIFLVVLTAALILVPKADAALTDAESALEEIYEGAEKLNQTAEQLGEIDFKGLVDDTQKMVNEGSEGISKAIGKIEEMDIEGLNKAIGDLGSVVEPLAKLFGKR